MSIYDTKAIDEAAKKMEEEQKKRDAQAIATINASYDPAIKNAQAQYQTSLRDTDQQYADLIRQNEVQKEIDKRNIEETMANLGMTNSGLNRTQQTATQLRFSNNHAQYVQKLQSAKDTLIQGLNEYLAGIDSAKAQYAANLQTQSAQNMANYKNQLYQNAQNNEAAIQQAKISQQTTIQKAQIEANKAAQKAAAEASKIKLTYDQSKSVWSNLAGYQKNNDPEAAEKYMIRLVNAGYIPAETASQWLAEYFPGQLNANVEHVASKKGPTSSLLPKYKDGKTDKKIIGSRNLEMTK